MAILILMIGYFAGREHLRHETQSSFAQHGEAFERELQKELDALGDNPGQLEAEAQVFKNKIPLGIGVAYRDKRFTLTLTEVRIDSVKTRELFSGTIAQLNEKYLLLKFYVKNTDKRKVLNFYGIGIIGNKNFDLYDDVENRVGGIGFKTFFPLVGAMPPEDINPGEDQTHVEVFEVPLPKTKYLTLILDLDAFEGDGQINFRIPAAEIKGFPIQ